ncbi:MAG TPA: sulfurtransferase [Methylomirabilota bacterium]|nr:sulfurtransferase [Methylomirabilota bacterium]
MGRSERSDAFLIETEWLAEHVSDPNLRIVDIRGIIKPEDQPKPWYLASREAYQASHIPGALFVDWLRDIVDLDAPIKTTVAPPEKIARVLGRLGIDNGTPVVVYDDDGGHVACRFWWVLNYYGHSDVKLLNGGWTKWTAERRPVTGEILDVQPVEFKPVAQPEWKAEIQEVRQALTDPRAVVVDTRSRKEYRGEVGRGRKTGRIPGAVNVYYRTLTDARLTTFKSPTEIQKLFAEAGVTPDKRVICYCNAGVSAAVDLFALKLAGYPRASNFAGSWYAWEADPSNPIAVGE